MDAHVCEWRPRLSSIISIQFVTMTIIITFVPCAAFVSIQFNHWMMTDAAFLQIVIIQCYCCCCCCCSIARVTWRLHKRQATTETTEKKGTHHPVQWGNRHRTEYVSQSQSISRPAASGVITRPNDDYFALKCCIYIVKWYHFNFSQPYTRPNGVNPIQ